MLNGPRSFDIRPTLAIAVFSLVLAGTLIAINSARPVDALASAGVVDVLTRGELVRSESAELVQGTVDARIAPRQIGSPRSGVAMARAIGGVEADASSVDGVTEADVDVPTTVDAPRTTVTTVPPSTAPVGSVPTTNRPTSSLPARPVTTTSTSTPRPTTTRPATTTTRPATTTTSATTTTTTRPATTTTTTAPSSNGTFTVAEVIDGTISSGDGSNPNEEWPMGRHDAPVYLPQTWDWAQGPTRNGAWGTLGTGGARYAEWRCAVIPELGHEPSVPFRINVRNGAYFQFVNGNWNKAFDVDLTSGHHGGYLGNAGVLNSDPFAGGHHGAIQWRREADGSYSAPWNPDALMMHFWAGRRQAPAAGQTAEFLTSEVRLQQPDGRTVDLSSIRVLFQCGIDYYNNTGGQGTKVPGPGIGKYHRVTTGWTPGLWVTLPAGTPAGSVSDFRNWLVANSPPSVRP